MIKIALPNNGKLNAGTLLPEIGKGTVQNLSSGAEAPSLEGDILPFPVIFAKMVNQDSSPQEAAAAGTQHTNSAENNAAEAAGITGEQKTSLFMLQIKGVPAGQENMAELSSMLGGNLISLMPVSEDGITVSGDEVVALELDLQGLLQVIQDGKNAGENAADQTGSEETVVALSSYLAAVISARQNQDGARETVKSDGIIADGQEVIAANDQKVIPAIMQSVKEMAASVIDNLSSLGNKLTTNLTDKGTKVLLTLPQELWKGFVIDRNEQPHVAPNGFGDTESSLAVLAEGDAAEAVRAVPADGNRFSPVTIAGLRIPVLSVTGEDPVSLVPQGMGENDSTHRTDSVNLYLALPTDEAEPGGQLVRLSSAASSSSPQGALLAAALGLQKANQPVLATPDAYKESAEGDGMIPVNLFQQETLVKNSGEHQVREMLLKPDAKSTGGKGATPAVTDSKEIVFTQNLELDEQDPISAGKGVGAWEEGNLLREDSAKGTPVAGGRDSAQWVPYAGASSPQVPLGAEAPLKGVFIPIDRVISESGAILEKGAGKVQMTLQPPSLGTINMEVVVQNNRVELVLTANHADVQQILQANSDQLKNALNSQGFQVDQMSVLLRRENFGFNLGGNPLWQNGGGQQQPNGHGSSASPETPEQQLVIPQDYGTGTISIFA